MTANGVDVTGAYQINLHDAGDVHLRAGYNNTRTKIVGTVATPPQLAAYSSVLFDRIEQHRIECGQPHDSLRLAKWLTDVEGSYRVGGYRCAIGAQNLFNVFPDRNSAVNSFNGIETFPRHSPFGMNGRSVYARIGYAFK